MANRTMYSIKHILPFLFAACLLAACESKQEKMLTKRWRVANVVFLDDEKTLAQNDTLQLQMVQRQRAVLKDVLMKNLYEFHKDGTYITGNAAATSGGEWELGNNAITFKSSAPADGETHTKRIPFEHLSHDSLVLILNNDQTSVNLKLVLLPVE
jgi:heat shock protein HslJ